MDTNGMKRVPLYSGLAHCARLTMGCCPVCPQSNNSKGSCSFALPWGVGQGLPPPGDPCYVILSYGQLAFIMLICSLLCCSSFIKH